MANPAETWAIGVDLALHHLGPLRFVAALLGDSHGELAVGIHVMPDPVVELLPVVTTEELDAFRERIATDVEQQLIGAGLEHARVELVVDRAVDRGLAEGVARLDAHALVVGRRAKRDDDPIIRLGEVTRRLLRRLPVPVIVVPPDFGEPEDRGFGEGPITVGVDLTEECVPAVLFAADLAARLERPLLLAHGIRAFEWGTSYAPRGTIDRLQAEARETAANALREWASPLGQSGARQRVFIGDPAKGLLQIAAEDDATMLVTGSRMLGRIERLFLASVSTEIAAGASCPVAVVPGH